MMMRLLAAHRPAVLAIVVLQLVQTTANLLLPTLNAAIIDDGIVRGNTGLILQLGGWMAGIAAVQVAAALAAGYLSATVAMDLGRQLRQELFAKVQVLSSQEVGSFGVPSLVTRATNDVQQIQALAVLVFTMLVAAPAMGVGGVVLALNQDVVLSGIVVAIIPVLVLIMSLIVRRMVPLYREGQVLIDRISRVLREQIIGANVIRAFVRQAHEARRFAVVNRQLTRNNLQSALLVAGMLPLIMIVVNLSSVAVVWFGGHRIQAGQMQLGSLTAFIAYILQILIAIMMAMYVLMTGPRAAVCAERIQAVLDTRPAIEDSVISRAGLPHVQRTAGGTVEFRDVTFAYPGAEAPVLDRISFTASPGTTTAIIGSTGSGKSTLLNLLPRFLDATSGDIMIGGHNVRSLPLHFLRNSISLVPQRAYLFSGTVAENLRIAAPEASDDDLVRALRSAQAEDFVRALPQGLHSPVSQGGTNFSGGQRQRLCIARALLRDAPVYLFDDSLSALDYATDARLRQALAPLTRRSTVIIVAERIATILDAGLILVLDKGKLVAQGTHSELLRTSTVYREIAASQLALGGRS
ncbi:ABC transporter ATP-binding protein [Arthrobacter sp. ISL-72]|uniref:ABC transporter ATP-binding protein n=1 Tax=Arthrobacter sp. ISL-72 TaxID=2819114 RepID=UPI001BE8D8A4|nr:ABC transporter ATP-binding protein [Arthrobacter sp. ISL-72]MBT2597178.1 ABC transporter ATP-binding protein [Arthrobacter sp. ISL-72]